MEQSQKDFIYDLIYQNRFSIFNSNKKEDRFISFLNMNDIKFNFDITISNVIKYLKNIDDDCLIPECKNKRIFIGIRNDKRTDFGFKKYCSGECYKKHISIRQKGKNNTCHRMSDETFKSMCDKNSKIMKDKIKNGEFKPNITNSWHKGFSYLTINEKIIKYRSSWEAFFHLCNTNLKYEDIIIQYKFENKNHNYIVDFVDYENKILYEIKPKSSIKFDKNIAKNKYTTEWCSLNGFVYKYITEKWILENFENNIHKLNGQPDKENIIRKIKRYKINEN